MKKNSYTKTTPSVITEKGGKKKLEFPPDIQFRTVAFRARTALALKLEKLARKNNTSVMAVATAIFEDVIDDYEL